MALLPGSRKQEIAKKLPIMLSVASYFPDYEFVVAKAPGQEDQFYEPFLAGQNNVKVVKDSTYIIDAIQRSIGYQRNCYFRNCLI